MACTAITDYDELLALVVTSKAMFKHDCAVFPSQGIALHRMHFSWKIGLSLQTELVCQNHAGPGWNAGRWLLHQVPWPTKGAEMC
jgi:hypothetical protein